MYQITKDTVQKFLDSQTVSVFSSVSKEGIPSSSAMYYVIDDKFNFYYLTASHTQKLEDISKNNHIAITVVDPKKPVMIQAQGTAEILEGDIHNDTRGNVIVKLAEKSAHLGKEYWPPPVTKLEHGEKIIIKVTPSALRYYDFSGGDVKKAFTFQVLP